MNSELSAADLFRSFSDTDLPELARTLLPHQRTPLPYESCAVALECPRTAALCFDRIWSVSSDEDECPDEIAFNCNSDAEALAGLWMHFLKNVYKQKDSMDEAFINDFANKLKENSDTILTNQKYLQLYSLILLGSTLAGSFENLKQPLTGMTRTICNALRGTTSRIIPVFGSEAARNAEFVSGDTTVIVTALRELDIVDENAISWEQVQEFRKDKTSRADYRRLVHWLEKDMTGRTAQYIIDEIGIRHEKYSNALKKHGLKSKLGALTSILDPKVLAAAGAAAGGALLVEQTLGAAFAAGSVLIGKVLVSVGQSKLDLHDIRSEHSDIAFVAQISERFSRS